MGFRRSRPLRADRYIALRKMLFVSHEASLTGAPRVAVEILRASAGLVDERVVLIRWPGPLSDELERAADRVRSEPLRRTRILLRRFRSTRKLAVKVEEFAAEIVLRRERPDLVYLNTVKSACYTRPAVDLGCRVVLHSHEMDPLASETLGRYNLRDLYSRIALVACSPVAKACLADITGVDDILVVPSVVDASTIQLLASEGSIGTATPGRESLERGFVVTCGTADRRKGVDLWLQVVRQVAHLSGTGGPVFAWIGQEAEDWQSEADTMGIGRMARFLGPLKNPYPVLADADIVVVPSRQDASPLVVLEAMSLGKPVVAFDVGGIRDQIGDAGVLVPAGDVNAMATAITGLLSDPEERRRLGELARRRAIDAHGKDRLHSAVSALLTSVKVDGAARP